MNLLPDPHPDAIIYEDERLYVCLASNPLTDGHTIVAWKDNVPDLHLLHRWDYEYLMDTVDAARNALLKVLNIEKVYLVYMDECRHVHWHLVPRYNEQGFNIFIHSPAKIGKFPLRSKLKPAFNKKLK